VGAVEACGRIAAHARASGPRSHAAGYTVPPAGESKSLENREKEPRHKTPPPFLSPFEKKSCDAPVRARGRKPPRARVEVSRKPRENAETPNTSPTSLAFRDKAVRRPEGVCGSGADDAHGAGAGERGRGNASGMSTAGCGPSAPARPRAQAGRRGGKNGSRRSPLC
jgi:hypothetical protein